MGIWQRHGVRAGRGPGSRAQWPGGIAAAAALADALTGPLRSEQPGAQPVAAVPTNVGENCPRLDVVTALAFALLALTVATAAPPKAVSSATRSDSNDRSATRLRMMILGTAVPL